MPVSALPLSSALLIKASETPIQSPLEKVIDKFKAVVLNPDTPLWLGNVGSIARSVEQIVSPFFETPRKVQKGLAASQFTAALNAPFNIYEVATGLVKVIKERKKEIKLDHGLELVSNIGQLSEDVGGIASGLKDLNLFAHSFAWLTPLTIFSAATSLITYIIDGKTIYFCNQLLTKTKAKYADNLQGLLNKHAYHLERQGGVDINLCKKALTQIEAAASPDSKNEQSIVKAIRKRVKTRRLCQALNMVITTISVIATVIFLASSSQALLIAGAALIITLSLISMSRRAINIYSNHQFEQRINRLIFTN